MFKQPIDIKTAQKVARETGKELSLGDTSPMEAIVKDERLVKYIRSLGLSRKQVADSLPALLEYQADQAICSSCPGRDKCPKDNKRNEISLTLENGRLVRTNGPCRKERKAIELSRSFFIASCPSEWLGEKPNITNKRSPAFVALKEAIKGEEPNWVYLTGDSGSGKSFVLATFAGQYAARHPGSAFVSTSRIVEELKDMSINDKKEFEKMLERLSSCPLLVLDEFGNEFKSEYTYSSILFPIISARAKNGLTTFFASDFSFEEIEQMYESKVGLARAGQLYRLLKARCKKTYDISGQPVD